MFFCFAQWHFEGRTEEEEEEEEVLHRVTQKVFLCKIVMFVCVASIN